MALVGADEVKRIGLVGNGVIGSGWAAVFVAHGFDVIVHSRSEAEKHKCLQTMEDAWVKLHDRGLVKDSDGYLKVKFASTMEGARGAAPTRGSVVSSLTLYSRGRVRAERRVCAGVGRRAPDD